MSMTKRNLLWQAIKMMFVLVAAGFVFVLFRSLGGPATSSAPIGAFDDVVTSQTAFRRYANERVWVTRLSDIQRNQAKVLEPLLKDPDSGCNPQVIVCVLQASTARSGIDLAFSDSIPAQLNGNAIWYGGYVDPTTGAVFDRLGRAYKQVRTDDKRNSLRVLQ